MITSIIFYIWFCLVLVPLYFMFEEEKKWPWLVWALFAVFWVVPIFTGVRVENNVGQYKGYVTAIEKNGAIFKGFNVYLKTELESSDVDIACINRDDQVLITELTKAQEAKESVLLGYRGVWQFAIGECPRTDWMIMDIIRLR